VGFRKDFQKCFHEASRDFIFDFLHKKKLKMLKAKKNFRNTIPYGLSIATIKAYCT
jgi:hypothetical protein